MIKWICLINLKEGAAMKRFWIGMGCLALISLVNFTFYVMFKPEDVIINRVFAMILGDAGTDFTPVTMFGYLFYHAFGDAFAVLMMMLFIALFMKGLGMEANIWYYRLILALFLVFETLQLWMPGNFKWVDMAAYIIFYHIGLRMVEWIIEKRLRVPFTHILTLASNRD